MIDEKLMEVHRLVFSEIVSAIRMLRELSTEDYEKATKILAIMRRAERDKDSDEGKEAVAAKVAEIVLDLYFKEAGDWSKMERRITAAATKEGLDVSTCDSLIAEALASKLAKVRALKS